MIYASNLLIGRCGSCGREDWWIRQLYDMPFVNIHHSKFPMVKKDVMWCFAIGMIVIETMLYWMSNPGCASFLSTSDINFYIK